MIEILNCQRTKNYRLTYSVSPVYTHYCYCFFNFRDLVSSHHNPSRALWKMNLTSCCFKRTVAVALDNSCCPHWMGAHTPHGHPYTKKESCWFDWLYQIRFRERAKGLFPLLQKVKNRKGHNCVYLDQYSNLNLAWNQPVSGKSAILLKVSLLCLYHRGGPFCSSIHF